mgnify:CR=1 FL=1
MSSAPRVRLKLDSVESRSDDGKISTEVVLSFQGAPIHGRSPLVDAGEHGAVLRGAALATLDAIETFVERAFYCSLNEVDRVHALGKELVVLLIDMNFEGRQIQLFGSCRAGDDATQAAAKAALDATNRYIDIVIGQRNRNA